MTLASKTSVDWVFWRPVDCGIARDIMTVKREWSVIEIFEAHELLDLRADIEELAARKNNKRGEG